MNSPHPGTITLVTGGRRSGKSRWAEELARASSNAQLARAGSTAQHAGTPAQDAGTPAQQDSTTETPLRPLAPLIYLATAHHWDAEFSERIARHQADRGPEWHTVEEERAIATIDLPQRAMVLLDCVTLWLTNLFSDTNGDRDRTLATARSEWDRLATRVTDEQLTLIAVTNEIGMGVHPESDLANRFVDVQGFMNQHIARSAQRVVLMVSGIPHVIKEEAP